ARGAVYSGAAADLRGVGGGDAGARRAVLLGCAGADVV
ncbi:MAG: hypothetical protein AVDCRST_MAG18-5040, partial [uncultured Thermomicrobiales bacterium]